MQGEGNTSQRLRYEELRYWASVAHSEGIRRGLWAARVVYRLGKISLTGGTPCHLFAHQPQRDYESQTGRCGSAAIAPDRLKCRSGTRLRRSRRKRDESASSPRCTRSPQRPWKVNTRIAFALFLSDLSLQERSRRPEFSRRGHSRRGRIGQVSARCKRKAALSHSGQSRLILCELRSPCAASRRRCGPPAGSRATRSSALDCRRRRW